MSRSDSVNYYTKHSCHASPDVVVVVVAFVVVVAAVAVIIFFIQNRDLTPEPGPSSTTNTNKSPGSESGDTFGSSGDTRR